MLILSSYRNNSQPSSQGIPGKENERGVKAAEVLAVTKMYDNLHVKIMI